MLRLHTSLRRLAHNNHVFLFGFNQSSSSTRTLSTSSATMPPKFPDPKLSASVVLLYPLRRPAEDGYNYRILFLKRHSNSSTFVDAHVFPGGAVDEADSETEWNDLVGTPQSSADLDQRTLKICAIREAFEEAGILLSEEAPDFSDEKRWQWRQRVRNDAKEFVNLFKEIKSKPAVSLLAERGNWITPRGIRRRFDTHFYISVIQRAQPPPEDANVNANGNGNGNGNAVVSSADSAPRKRSIVVADGKETVAAHWLTPAEVVDSAIHGSKAFQYDYQDDVGCILFPPQFYLTAELLKFKDWRDIGIGMENNNKPLINSRGQSLLSLPQRKVFPFEPQAQKTGKDCDGADRVCTCLPGDELYTHPTNIPSKPGQKNRVYVVQMAATPGGVVDTNHRTSPKKEDSSPSQKKRLASGYFRVLGFERKGVSQYLGPGWEDVKHGIDDDGEEIYEKARQSKL